MVETVHQGGMICRIKNSGNRPYAITCYESARIASGKIAEPVVVIDPRCGKTPSMLKRPVRISETEIPELPERAVGSRKMNSSSRRGNCRAGHRFVKAFTSSRNLIFSGTSPHSGFPANVRVPQTLRCSNESVKPLFRVRPGVLKTFLLPSK